MTAFSSLCNVVLLSTLSVSSYAVGSDGTTDCNSEEGCSHENMINSYVYCRGFRSCHDSSIEASYTVSSGDLSNSYSDIESYYMYNYGRYSSYFSDISTIFIENLGYYSASYADIKPYANTLYAYFYGYYSGFYSDVSCYDGNTCKIYCNNGGCQGLHFYCYENSICHYDCSSDTSYCPILYSSNNAQITSNIGNNNNKNEHTGLADELIKVYYDEHKITKGEKSDIIPDVSDKFKSNEKEFTITNAQDAEETIIKEIEMTDKDIVNSNNDDKNTNNKNKNIKKKGKNSIRVFAVDEELSGDLIGGARTHSHSKKNGGLLSQIKWTQYMVACIIDLAIFIILFKAFSYIKNKRNVELMADLDERQQRAQITDEYDYEDDEEEQQQQQQHYDLDYQSTQQQQQHYYCDINNINNNNNNYQNYSSMHEQEVPIRHNEYTPLFGQFY